MVDDRPGVLKQFDTLHQTQNCYHFIVKQVRRLMIGLLRLMRITLLHISFLV